MILFLFLLTSCQNFSENSNSSFPYDYDLWAENRIGWKEIFTLKEEHYHVYFYSPSCGHCRSIKEEVLTFYLKEGVSMYVVSEDQDIVYAPVNQEKTMIGVASIDDLSIPGVPTLIYIEAHAVNKFLVGAKSISTYFQEYDR